MDDKDTIVQLAKMLAEATKDAEAWRGLYNSMLATQCQVPKKEDKLS